MAGWGEPEDRAFFHPRFTSTELGSRYDSGCESQQVARPSGGSKSVGWRMFSCTANGSIHFAIESTSGVSAPISLVALTDILFLTYLRTLEVTAGVTALRPHDVVVAKVKSVTGLSVLICLPSTTTLGIIHHAWLLATAWTDVEPSIRLVVDARQVMPHIPIAHVARNGRCTVNSQS